MSDSQTPLIGGESTDDIRQCGTPALNRHLVATDPGYKSRRLAIQQFHRALRQGESLQPGFTESLRGGSYSIPVVFHVVYHTAEQKTSDAQIDSQITVLNADFSAANADRVDLPPVFQPLVELHISGSTERHVVRKDAQRTKSLVPRPKSQRLTKTVQAKHRTQYEVC